MPIKPIQPGQPITARAINAGIEARNMLDVIGVSPPLEMVNTKNGRFLRLAMAIPGTEIAQAGSGGIPARSGATPGSGSVTIQKFAPPTLAATPLTVTCYNLASTAVGATKYIVMLKVHGYWFAVWEDCG